ncbi:SDR family NAD(P)-dependent oxidoreductase [Streptosporangiaceae bacterium NEAU-GS5]|nr:SDR family NAD(P)-dependent oxidoreductase [Streptosporangiaceae bacterium NEAU-GS5]
MTNGVHPLEPIAVVGMAVRLPGADSVEEYWRNLADGVESVRFFTREEQAALGVPASRLDDPGFVPAAAMIDDIDYFDAGFFGMTPREAEVRDPQQRLFLELAHRALEDAGHDPSRYPGEIGVYAGTGADEYQWHNIRRNPSVLAGTGSFGISVANHPAYLSTFASYKLNLRGPSLTLHTACSTSLVAAHLACEALRNGECEMALAGAASIDLPHGWGYVYAEGGVTSPDGHCRAFDARSAGMIWGSGGGVVVLKRLSDALADGDTVRAVILGNAVNNDGSDKVGFSAPSVAGQAAVISQALGVAGVDPRTIGYVEAHGTGTALGDPIEVAALTSAFGVDHDRPRWCALGSVKTNIGHLASAAGVAGLVKAVLALEHAMIPPSLHYDTPHPKIDFESGPFYVNTALSPWPSSLGPRRAGVSSFGVGGTNAHLVLQQAPPIVAERRDGPVLLQVSARTPTALGTLAERLADHIEANPGVDLAAAAYTLRRGRRAHQHRMYVVAEHPSDAAAALVDPERRRLAPVAGQPPRVAFLFAGQGSQYPGMGAGLYRAEPVYRDAVDECAGHLNDQLGLDVRDLLHASRGDEVAGERLARTAFTQPALFTVEYALAALWASWGVEPAAMIGHSVGEYVAATLAGVFPLPDALRLVARRGRLMRSLPPGAMLSVALGEAEVRRSLPDGLSVAAVNGPANCVVSGPVERIDAYAAESRDRGVGVTRLRTSHAFHSAMMEPILADFRDEVAAATRRAPERAMLSNLTGGWATAAELTDPSYWARHLRETVRFGDGAATLLAEGDWALVEVGPGRQLSALARPYAAKSAVVASLPAPDDPTGDLTALLNAAGRLWAAGVDVDAGPPTGRRVPLPTYPFERKRYWVTPTEEADAPPQQKSGQLPMDDWYAVPAWRQIPAVGRIDSRRERIVVIGAGLAATELAGRLRAGGADVHLAAPGLWCAHGELPTRIVHVTAWRAEPAGPDPDAAWAAQETGFFGVLSLVQKLAAAQPEQPVHLDIVTAGTQSVLGDDLRSPEHATMAGHALVLPLELPWLTVRHVDAAAGPAQTDVVVAELLRPPPEGAATVALRGGRRWVRDWEPVRLPAVSAEPGGIRQEAVCLITGGLGGIGISVAEDLAARLGARLVLLGRTGLPGQAEWDRHLAIHGTSDRAGRAIAAIRRMERDGGEVMVLDADVTDVAALLRVRARIIERFGRLDAIVHAAGVPGGGMAEVKERAQAEAVLAPKIRGTLALAKVFGDLPLDAVVLCGSVTGIAGGFGQVDYCGANAFMDAVAQAGTASGLFRGRAVAIDWGGWLDVGMAAEVVAPSAFRALQRGLVSTPMGHPVLTTAHRDPTGDVAWCTGVVGPRTHWVLDEHRIGGHAMMSGTGHVATVLAAARAALDAGDRPIELRDVMLVEPFAVDDDGQAEYRVAFAEGADDVDFQVTSRAAGLERAHVRGTVVILGDGTEDDPPPIHDLAAIRERCRVPVLAADRAAWPGGDLATLGPRWSSLRQIEAGVQEEIALFEAGDLVAAELDQWGVHPGLLDEAITYGIGQVEGDHLPMGYGRIRFRGPLPARFWSHVRYRDQDASGIVETTVTLFDDAGVEIASIGEFVFRKIDFTTFDAGLSARAAPSTAFTRAGAVGIAPADGAEALRRVLATDLGAQVSVTATGVRAALAAAQAVTQQTVASTTGASGMGDAAGPAADLLDGDHTPPGTELERVLSGLWQDVLGVERIGVHDDFFELGGNSLVAVQLLARIRKEAGRKIPMRTLFEEPTVARMAAAITGLSNPGIPDEPITALPRA